MEFSRKKDRILLKAKSLNNSKKVRIKVWGYKDLNEKLTDCLLAKKNKLCLYIRFVVEKKIEIIMLTI